MAHNDEFDRLIADRQRQIREGEESAAELAHQAEDARMQRGTKIAAYCHYASELLVAAGVPTNVHIVDHDVHIFRFFSVRHARGWMLSCNPHTYGYAGATEIERVVTYQGDVLCTDGEVRSFGYGHKSENNRTTEIDGSLTEPLPVARLGASNYSIEDAVTELLARNLPDQGNS